MKWVAGQLGSGYEKLTLLKFPCLDMHLIRFPKGSHIDPHVDPAPKGRQWRMNVVLKVCEQGGDFVCPNAFVNWRRLKIFRPDVQTHEVTRVTEGDRLVLTVGAVL